MEIIALVVVIIGLLGLFLKKKKLSPEERKEKGDVYEKKVGKEYENKGYSVIYNGLEKGRKDGGIDLICSKENEILLIQCKNWENSKINYLHVKAFHSDCIKYIDENNLDKNDISLKFVIPNFQIISNNAIYIFKNKYYKCRYEII